jgi:hypothetical protein
MNGSETKQPDLSELTNVNNPSQFQQFFKKLTDNKIYIYICGAVVLLGIILYYLYVKNKKNVLTNNVCPLTSNVENKTNKIPVVLNPSKQEYYVLDENSNPVKISGNFLNLNQEESEQQPSNQLKVPLQQPSQNDIMMLQKQMMEKQRELELQAKQNATVKQAQINRVQMEQKINNDNVEHYENNESEESEDDIDIDAEFELSRIKSNEKNNMAKYDLTQSELEEIKTKLENMNKNI